MKMIDFEELDFDQARNVKQSLENLIDSPGWAIIVQFIESRTEIRNKALVETIPENVEQMVRMARLKGQTEELSQFPSYVGQLLNDVTEELRRIQDEEQSQLDLGDEGYEFEGR